jgi:ribosomal-protein-serine acetyltransferase
MTHCFLPRLLESERLFLRAVETAWTKLLQEALEESWPELRAALPWASSPDPQTWQDTQRRLREQAAIWDKGAEVGEEHSFHLFEKESGRLVGAMGLRPVDPIVPSFEIGYWTRTSAAGRGYMSEAVRALAKSALDDLGARRVQILCATNNPASARVALKAGFVQEGILRNGALGPGGKLVDKVVFSKIPGDPAGERQKSSAG